MSAKPKPCPWCGEVPRCEQDGDGAYVIFCNYLWCPTNPSFICDENRDEAIEAWNTRKGEKQP